MCVSFNSLYKSDSFAHSSQQATHQPTPTRPSSITEKGSGPTWASNPSTASKVVNSSPDIAKHRRTPTDAMGPVEADWDEGT